MSPNFYNLHKLRAVKVTQDGSSAKIHFKNNNDRSYKSVICADGIHSIGKEAIFPPNTFEEPDHSGTAAIQDSLDFSVLFGNGTGISVINIKSGKRFLYILWSYERVS